MQHEGIFIGLGSNLGDRGANLARGVALLESRGLRVTGRSSIYETEPVGGPPQGWYLNAVVRGESALAPEALLAVCLEIEAELGRRRREANEPRPLDLDLLLYGERVVSTPQLICPHPRVHERRFVLVPLAEVDPEVRHPILGRSAAELLAACADPSRVVRLRVQAPA
jgi:2-amino-4-hydroxy-6-hydroxymethyldihydropteridine diphosphokinase